MAGARGGKALSKGANRLICAGIATALALVPAAFIPQLYDDFTLIKQAGLAVAAALTLAGLVLAGFPMPAARPARIALGVWLFLVVVSEWLALDPRGSVLGVYQYRQGLVTQLSYVVLFLGGAHLRAIGSRFAERALLIGGLAVLGYTVVQGLGLDPVDWWTDTSERAIGTIGNANELAAFAVVALAALPVAFELRGRTGPIVAAAITGSVCFVALQAESRSGLGALVLFVLLVPVAWWVAKNPWRTLARPGAAVLAGFAAGTVCAFAIGSLGGTAGRVQGGVAGTDAGGSTRLALWEGTLAVIRAEPLHGAGPDGLFLAFPVHRPADLGGAYESYDLVAQSSHNLVLDTAANYGIPALAAFAALVVLASTNSVRQARRHAADAPSTAPWAWAALAAYGALTLLNPISLAAHAAFFVVLGGFAAEGRRLPSGRFALAPVALRAALVAPAVIAAFFLATRMVMADYRANQAWDNYAAKKFDAAAADYSEANALMPLERRYATDYARSLLAAGVDGPPGRLRDAEEAFTELQTDFGFTSGDAIGLATARIGLHADASRIAPVIDEALRLNPHGVSMAAYTQVLRDAVVRGGTLHYADRDRWVYVEAGAAGGSTPEPR